MTHLRMIPIPVVRWLVTACHLGWGPTRQKRLRVEISGVPVGLSTSLVSMQNWQGQRVEDHLCSNWFRGAGMELGSFHQWIQKYIIKNSLSLWALWDARGKQRMKSRTRASWIKTIASFWTGAELSELSLPLLLNHGHVWLHLNRKSCLWCVLHCFKRALGPYNNFWICLVSSLGWKEIAFRTRKLLFA